MRSQAVQNGRQVQIAAQLGALVAMDGGSTDVSDTAEAMMPWSGLRESQAGWVDVLICPDIH